MMSNRVVRIRPETGRSNRVLTEVGKDDMLNSPDGSRTSRGTRLPEPEWLSLVERLLELTPEDFASAILAVRLARRLEERSRHDDSGVPNAMREQPDRQGRPARSRPRTSPAGTPALETYHVEVENHSVPSLRKNLRAGHDLRCGTGCGRVRSGDGASVPLPPEKAAHREAPGTSLPPLLDDGGEVEAVASRPSLPDVAGHCGTSGAPTDISPGSTSNQGFSCADSDRC